MKLKTLLAICLAFFGFSKLSAQNFEETMSNGQIRGNFQFDMQYYQEDSAIGAQQPSEEILSNGFLNLIYTNGNFSTGIRYESYQNALLGFPNGYKGNGLTYRFATFKKDKLTVTAGNFYEQFGNGLAFRSYEERGLGYDNAMDGIRIKYELMEGINLTGLTGKQRIFFEYGEGIVRGFDADISLNSVFKSLKENKTKIRVGGSAVSKYQADQDSRYVLPENVATFAGRVNINRGKINFNGEYAYKSNDPSGDNGFIYKPGEAIFLQSSYSQKGLGLVLSAKRNDNMSFRSNRTESQQNLLINYLPALTKQHTYNLLATLYPYATQLNGEVAFQADLIYKFKKGTMIGGENGMDIQINYSTANNIDTTQLNDENTLRKGYKSDYFKIGEVFFKDFNFQIDKKFSNKIKGRFTYANLVYNQEVIAGKPGNPTVYANVGIADVTYKFTMRNSLRTEAQVLLTEQDHGDWATLLLEYSYSPHWFVAILDQYNYGNAISKQRVHYYNASVGYNNKGNRITMSYGRQRAGIFCVGGVCRVVPASNGLYLSITSSF
ncbi:MAG: hypothetical protein DWP98_04055 [Bacteroidetes bacterium]|nr:MAG: hypothetical protein DWP98_04055 [Bacteroidota bacterium]MBL1143375.1 hypothetical protein [Bacteroidota bacterium]MCB0803030.1 hypothetical protein [Flavobacteriales bacterium]NOG56178.1 hypothetical protein [Bacteroidota bacterium]